MISKNRNKLYNPPQDARSGAHVLIEAVLLHKQKLAEACAALALSGPEMARAQRLTGLTLRYLSKIDAALALHLRRKPAQRTQTILRLALAELYLDKAATYGVVSAAVSAARAHPRSAPQAGLVNAVLRKISQNSQLWDTLPAPRLPNWIRSALQKAYGHDRLFDIEAAHFQDVPLDLTLKGAVPDGLEGVHLPTGSLRLKQAQVTALPGYEAGAFWVQDAAAAIAVRTLGDVSGQKVLDLCAAPGGKTLQLAAAGADVTALDVSEKRLDKLRENLSRTKLKVKIVTANALDWTSQTLFDAIVLDAPCSATGTLRRHPDLQYLRKVQDVEALTKLQYQLLDRALTWLKPKGRLVYCTCSLLPVEGEYQMAAALKRHPNLKIEKLNAAALGLPQKADVPQGLRLLPDLWPEYGGMDGFFVGKMYMSG